MKENVEERLNEDYTRTTTDKNGAPEDIVLKQQAFSLDDFFNFFLSVPGFYICFQIDQI